MKVFHIQNVIFLSVLLSTFGAHALEREKSVTNCAGEVVTVRGTVLVRQETGDGKSKETLELKAGNNVYPGDVINTASDGAVKILLKDKTIVDLGGSALFKVAQFKPNDGANREVELDMMFGKMRVAVPKKLEGEGKFQIKTRAATMGVRGTEFVVTSALESKATATEKAAPPQTSVVVLQGKVDVAKPGETAAAAAPMHLTAGNQITTQVGAPTGAMVKLNESQMSTVSSSSKVADNTFTKAVTIEAAPAQRTSSSNNSSNTASNSSSGSSRAPAEAGSSASSATAAAAAAPLAGSLQSSMATIAAEVPTVSVSFSELGVPGAPSVANTVTAVAQKQSSYHVTVTVGQ